MRGQLSILIAALVAMAPAAGQEEQGDRPAPLIKAKVEVVNILATVRDREGNYVGGLTRDDFEIYEDGRRQEIEFFSYESGEDAQPLTIVLLMDTSGSVKDKLEFERMAAMEFFNQTLRENKDLAAIVQFDSEINLVQDFTFDLATLENALKSIRAGGWTRLYDAIYVAVDDLLRHQYGRRVLVTLSDGKDTNSVYSREKAIRKAQDEDVIIFGIGVRSPGFSQDFDALENFAKSTGGDFFKSKVQLSRLRAAFKRINAEIKNQYSIGYISTNKQADGRFREIEVKLNKRGLKVRHRDGYYAPGAFPEADSGS